MSFSLTPSRRPHATKPDCGFVLPPLDGSLSLAQIYDFHYRHNANYTVFIHPTASGDQVELTYKAVVPAIHQAARLAAEIAGLNLDAKPQNIPAIAVLAASDTISYITTVLGIMRAGIPAFLLAPRCSVPAVAALISKKETSHILISPEPSMRELAEAGLALFKADNPGKPVPEIRLMPTYDQLYIKDAVFTPVPALKRDFSAPRLILHSSGSTSLPKPIPWNDRVYLQIMVQSYFAKQDMCGQIYAAHGLAMFHSVAWAFIAWIPATGLKLATFEPAAPATIPTPEAVFQGWVQSRAAWGFAMPSFIEQWASDDAKVEHLKTMTGVTYGGGPLNKHVGDTLIDKGVQIHVIYGTTEVGAVAIPFYECLGKDWEYVGIDPELGADFVPIGDGSFELVFAARPDREITVVNAQYKGKDAHSISDLLVPHPTKKGLWKIIGRSDDQITLSTGEKTNPGPLESILCLDNRVQAAVMFGRGRAQVGVVVELKPEFAFDPKDEAKLIEFRNALWPRVEQLNKLAPSHSRLFKEMVLVTTPSKPFPYTGKGTVRKAKVIEEYEPEIEALYNQLEEMTQTEPPSTWTADSSFELVKSVVENVLKRELGKSEDMFEAGCDSLQATWIRNSFMYALRKTPSVSMDKVSPNFVYENPNIAALSKYLLSIVLGVEVTGSEASRVEEVVEFLSRYTRSFPRHVASVPAPNDEVVLLTGTTGALGTAVLAHLIATESIAKVYAYNRPSSSKSILERQKEALESRGYDAELASSSKLVLVEGKLDASGLGVSPELEDEIRQSITHIIHTAWRVDFNLSLGSFEGSIGGIRSLVNLALSSPHPSPPHLSFSSSIGALRNLVSRDPVRETLLDDPAVSIGLGYGESKWIAERILNAAAKDTPLCPTVFRIGQISGGKNGNWNSSDWLPAIIKSSLTLGCLPQFKGLASWIPLDVIAQTIVDMRNEHILAANLAHPKPVPCKDLFEHFSKELSIPLVSYEDWVSKLEQASAAVSTLNNSAKIAEFAEQVPAYTLLEFFRGALQAEKAIIASGKEDLEAMGFPMLVTENAKEASESFKNASILGSEDVKGWLAYWKSVGFISY